MSYRTDGNCFTASAHHPLTDWNQNEKHHAAGEAGGNRFLQRPVWSALQDHRELHPQQYYRPTEIYPHQKDWNRGERAVVGAIAHDTILEMDVGPLRQRPQQRGQECTYQGWTPSDPRVGKEDEQDEVP